MSNAIDSLGQAGAQIMMRGAVSFIRSHAVPMSDAKFDAVIAALRTRAPKAIDEVLELGRGIIGSPMANTGVVDAVVAATFMQHGIAAAKEALS